MSNLYFIMLGVAVLLIIYFYFVIKKGKKMNLLQPSQPITFRQEQILAHGAILAKYRREDVLSMAFNLTKKGTYVDGLASQWDVTDHNSAVSCIRDLIELKKSTELDKIYQSEKDTELTELFAEIAKDLEIPVENVKRVQSVYAWDTCRAINVAKWSYWVGYLTEEEAWRFMSEASDVAQSKGIDWEEYTCSFLIGRDLHGFGIRGIVWDCDNLLQGKGKCKGVYSEHPFK